ncbi:MAG: Transcriptional regulator [Ignavibacteriae bacterium]|nr:MAG: Transcriptional regulator [Ignavibacteriota bacterium]
MKDYPTTQAIRILKENKVNFIPHLYKYIEHGGTRTASIALGVPEHYIIKTIVMQTDEKKPLIVLMHGDYEVSTKNLARIIRVKHIEPSDESTAQKATGYVFGGMSPLGTRQKIPIYAEKTIFSLNKIFINAGKRGFLVEINPEDLRKILEITEVEVGIKPSEK